MSLTSVLRSDSFADQFLQTQAAKVENEVQTWAEQYKRAAEAHGRSLCAAAAKARERYRQEVESRTRDLQDTALQAVDAVKFAEEVSVSQYIHTTQALSSKG
jgi:BMFP domain-containing protein YqiC